MAKLTYHQLQDGYSFSGTYLYSQKADAEGIAALLGLSGAFPFETDEGKFWMPGQSYDELMKRIYSTWTVPDAAPVPQAHPQNPSLLTFKAYLDTHRR
jgi:hypothetical protein